MLVNGKEVSFTMKQVEATQQDINKVSQLPDELKQGISNKELRELIPSFDVDNSSAVDVANIQYFENQNQESFRTRKENYDTYKEMDNHVFIHRAIETVADDASMRNDEGDTIKIYSDSENTKELLSDLFKNRLNMNKELWSIVYETIKMGDNFYEVIPDSYEKPKKIVKIRYLEPSKVERIEFNDKLAYFTYKDDLKNEKTQKKEGEKIYRLQPWQIIHFKIDNKEFEPYGGSLLAAGVRTFRRLALLEDVMIVYRISRSPERRVFYVDVGQLSPVEAKRFLQKFRDNYRTQQFIDDTGKINRKANALSITSDIFIPVREGSQGTRIDTLQSGNALNSIDDLKYFKEEILMTMNVPLEYLGQTADRSRSSLSSTDHKFAKFVERVQTHIEDGLNKIAALELFFAGYKRDDLQDFKLELTPPSNIKEITDLEFINQRMGLISTILQLNIFPIRWILKKILRLSDKEISDIMLYKDLEDQRKAGGAQGTEAGMVGGMGGVTPGMGDAPAIMPGMEAPAPAPEGEVPAAGVAPEVPAPEVPVAPEEQLNASTIVNLLGQEFLLENQEDFFKIVKALEEEKQKPKVITEEIKEETSVLMEAISSILFNEVDLLRQKNINKRTEKLSSMFFKNEFGGLVFTEGKRAIKILKEQNGVFKEKEILL
jgi:hypothetical protein